MVKTMKKIHSKNNNIIDKTNVQFKYKDIE